MLVSSMLVGLVRAWIDVAAVVVVVGLVKASIGVAVVVASGVVVAAKSWILPISWALELDSSLPVVPRPDHAGGRPRVGLADLTRPESGGGNLPTAVQSCSTESSWNEQDGDSEHLLFLFSQNVQMEYQLSSAPFSEGVGFEGVGSEGADSEGAVVGQIVVALAAVV